MPTLGNLAAKPGARFTFRCRPCNHMVVFTGAEIVERYSSEVLFEHFQRRVICGKCRLPVDGDFRTMEFSAPQGMGGWSGSV